MKSIKKKKKDYQKEIIFFMWVWIFIFGLGFILDLIDVAFGESFNIISTIIYVLYLIFFGFGLHFARKGKMIAGFFELVAGIILFINDFLPDKKLGLYGIIGLLVLLHAILYLYYCKKINI